VLLGDLSAASLRDRCRAGPDLRRMRRRAGPDPGTTDPALTANTWLQLTVCLALRGALSAGTRRAVAARGARRVAILHAVAMTRSWLLVLAIACGPSDRGEQHPDGALGGDGGAGDLCHVQSDDNGVPNCTQHAPPDSFDPDIQWTWMGPDGETNSE